MYRKFEISIPELDVQQIGKDVDKIVRRNFGIAVGDEAKGMALFDTRQQPVRYGGHDHIFSTEFVFMTKEHVEHVFQMLDLLKLHTTAVGRGIIDNIKEEIIDR